ncbi:EF-hand domain-containing protein [Mycena kentingensis (nom. inval.)]|nr:EF-hand domain-containing protein [Mycena kentingensis (nom. inval.)]
MPLRKPPGELDIGPSNHQRTLPETCSNSQDAFLSPNSTDDLTPASPPYKRKASRPNFLAPGPDLSPTPSYTSYMPDTEEKGKTKAAVHYPDILPAPAVLHPVEDDPKSSAPSSVANTDDEDSDYDWDDDADLDLADEAERFERKIVGVKRNPGWGFKRRVAIIALLFSSLLGSTLLAGIIVAPALIVHFFWYRPHQTETRHRITLNVEAWLFWAAANLLTSWYLALLIDMVPSVVKVVVSISWGHISESLKSRIELYNSVKNTIKPVFYAASCWVSWVIIFDHIFKMVGDGSKNHQAYTSTVYQVVEFFFFLTLVLCAQRLLSHLIAFAFHRTAFKDRLDAVYETLAVVEKLRVYRPKSKRSSGLRTPLFGGAFGALGTPAFEKDSFNFLSNKLKDHKKNPEGRDWVATAGQDNGGTSAAPSRPLSIISEDHSPHQYPPSRDHAKDATLVGTVGTAAKLVKDTLMHDARNIRGEDEVGNMEWNVSSAYEAKRLARSIYMRLKAPTRNYLLPADFRPAFPTQEAADAAFGVFDKDNNGDLSRAEIKSTLVKVYKERRFLARAMRDVGAALKSLDHILLFFALGIQFFISLSVFGVDITSSLTSVYSLVVAASFIFKSAASSAFDSIMLLFVTHPFDTGDRCFIANEVMTVKRMGLFATTFTRWDGTESYYFNSQLCNMFITNVRRSGKMFENLTMQVAWRTPMEKLDALEAAMNKWLSTEENRWFVPSTGVTLQHIAFQRYLEFTMGIGHNGTWQDWSLRNARKTAFHAAVQHYCRELGIECYNSPQPIIWTDPNTVAAVSSPYDPLSPSPGPAGDDTEMDMPVASSKPPPTLGFVPHADSNLLRARTKGRKAAMRAAGGGDM